MTKIRLLLTSVLLLAASTAHAATYYVSPTSGSPAGSDARSCTTAQTISTPKATIASAKLCLAAGDTLDIRTGTYAESISAIKSGTSASARTVIQGHAGETVTIRPNVTGGRIIQLVGTTNSTNTYVHFKHLILDGNSVSTYGINSEQSAGGHNRFEDVEIKNIQDNAIILGPSDGGFNEFINVNAHHAGLDGNGNGIYLQASNNLIDGGLWHDNSSNGITLYTGFVSYRVSNNIIRNAKIYSNGASTVGNGMSVWVGDNNQIYNNVIYRNGHDGIQVNHTTGTKVYNNTVYASTGNGISISSDSTSAIVRNNIVYSNVANITNSNSGTTLSNNLTTNPTFVDTATNDYHLQTSSTAKDTGATIVSVTTDHDGVARPQGSFYDIGAYEFKATPTTTPPSSLRVTGVTETTIALAWNDNSSTEAGFEVYKSTDNDSFTKVGSTTSASATTVTVSGLTAATTYYFKVRAEFAGPTYSTYTGTVTQRTLDDPQGLPPTSLRIIDTTTTTLTLEWIDNSVETGFELDKSQDNVTFTNVTTTASNATSHTVTGLVAGTRYYFRLRAVYSAGNYSPYIATSGTTSTTGTLPLAPSNLVLASATVSSLSLSWTDNSSVEQGFEVERSSDNNTFAQIGTSLGTVYTDSGLASGITRYYRVRAYNVSGPSNYSNTLTAATLVAVPAAPTNFRIAAVTTTTVALAWTDASSNETGFEVYKSTDGAIFSLVTTTAASASTYTVSSLTAGTLYYVKVRAVNGTGNSVYTPTLSVTTAAASEPLPLTITVTKKKRKGNTRGATVYWRNAKTTVVDVYRDGVKVASAGGTTTGTGSYIDYIGGSYQTAGTFTYKVCDFGAETRCSANVAVVF